jgi:hypothetical protein
MTKEEREVNMTKEERAVMQQSFDTLSDMDQCLIKRFFRELEMKPMTPKHIKTMMINNGYETVSLQEQVDFMNGIRHAEIYHGITGDKS